MIEKVTHINGLYDLYEPLLTAKQKQYFELYYHEDFSLSEIADQFGICRPAVFDNIKRTEKALESYEGKLRIMETKTLRFQMLKELERLIEKDETRHLIEAIRALDELE